MTRDSDTRRMAETGTGSVRSTGSAGLKGIANKLCFGALCFIALLLIEGSGILRAKIIVEQACPALEWSLGNG